jgi:uncharacterized protein (UPF0332 family)
MDLAHQTLALQSGRGRPRQAVLRRAVSTAYYALFHLLVREATKRMVLQDPAWEKALGRAFDHKAMKEASKVFRSGGTLKVIGTVAVPSDLKAVASAFCDLQEARHNADYNTAHAFTVIMAKTLMGQAEAAFASWNAVRKHPSAKLYLNLLITYQHLMHRK